MAKSYSATAGTVCHVCQEPFISDVWMIVDFQERPDLWDKCRDGSIYDATCPNGHTGALDSAMLLHDGIRRTVIFVPPKSSTDEEDERLVNDLAQRLIANTPEPEQFPYLVMVEFIYQQNIRAVLRADSDLPGPVPTPEEETDGLLGKINALLQQINGMLRPTEMSRRAELCLEALAMLRRSVHGTEWAILQTELGLSLVRSHQGDHAENIERAIVAFEASFAILTPKTDADRWAMAQTNLARCFQIRVLGPKDQNLKRSIEALEAALTVRTKDAAPPEWAQIQLVLAQVYRAMPDGDHAANREKAIEALELGLTVLTRPNAPMPWAITQTTLGLLYSERGTGDQAENLARAIQCQRDALTILTPDNNLEAWAGAANNLAQQLEPTRSAEARTLYQQALQHVRPDQLPDLCRQIARNLARLQIEEQDLEGAHATLLVAIEAGQRQYDDSLSQPNKAAEARDNASVFAFVVDVCLRLRPPRPAEAFKYSEQARARQLRDQLSLLPQPPSLGVPEQLLNEEARLLKEVRSLILATDPGLALPPEVRDLRIQALQRARSALARLWTQIESASPDYVAARRGSSPDWPSIQSWLQGQGHPTAIVEFYVLEDRIAIFVGRSSDPEPVVLEPQISARRLAAAISRFIEEVIHFDPGDPLDETWLSLGPPLLADLMPLLEGIDLAYLIPHRGLHLLPLHALGLEEKPMLDSFAVAYAPSVRAAMLMTAGPTRAVKSLSGANVLVVGDPSDNLAEARKEAGAVAAKFKCKPLIGEQASKPAVISELEKAELAHFAAHAGFQFVDPLSSGILLHGGDFLTARDLMTNPVAAKLFVLSGCETGLQRIDISEEAQGLAPASLMAGLPAVLTTKWSVDDPATTFLMTRFYEHLVAPDGAQKMPTVDALRQAMLEAKKLRPETYYWAPFSLVGDWR